MTLLKSFKAVKDYSRNSVEEEIKLTLDVVPGDKGQLALKESVKQFKQLRVWIWETKNAMANITVYSHM